MDTTSSPRGFWALIGAGLLVGGAIGVILLFGIPRASLGGADTLEVAPARGARSPDFSLQRIDGEQVSLRGYRGSPVLINFWATWCAPCRIEMPFLQERYERFAESHGLKVVAIDFDEPQPDVQAFAESFGLTFDLLLDPGGEVQRLYQIRGYPSSYFVDREGVVRVVHIGVMTEEQLDDNLKQIDVS